jgi:DNA modification methylase
MMNTADKSFLEDKDSFNRHIATLNDGAIVSTLEKLGRLKDQTLEQPLIELTKHKNPKIRKAAIKNLAKYANLKYSELFYTLATSDNSTDARREAVSALGRMRDSKNYEKLKNLLEDSDPKVVLQAMRGLIALKKEISLVDSLEKCKGHPNEQVQELYISSVQNNGSSGKRKEVKTDGITRNESLRNLVINGNTIEIMQMIGREAVDLTFTSPPYYNARDYSIYKSYKEYLDFLKEVFSNVYTITKEGRFLVVNSSPIIVPRISRAHSSKRFPIPFDLHSILVAIGWEFIDDIIWLKPEASAKNRNAGFLQHRKPLAYKPNAITEMLMVYRKKTDKLIDWNIEQYSSEIVNQSKVEDGYETSNVWKVDPTFDKTHSAVFPKALCERVIKYYSMKSDLIFDPFAGSGTLGKVASELGRNFLLTEIDETYFARIKSLLSDESIFSENDYRYFGVSELREYLLSEC